MLGECVGEQVDVGGRCEEDCALWPEALVHRQRYGSASQRMAHQSVHRPEPAAHIGQRAGELGQRCLMALGCSMRRRVEEHYPKAGCQESRGHSTEPSGPAAPAVGENHQRTIAPGPNGQIVAVASDSRP